MTLKWHNDTGYEMKLEVQRDCNNPTYILYNLWIQQRWTTSKSSCIEELWVYRENIRGPTVGQYLWDDG